MPKPPYKRFWSQVRQRLAHHRLGRVALHVWCMLHRGEWGWHGRGIWRELCFWRDHTKRKP